MDQFGGIRDVPAEIRAELNSLDQSYPHASKLLKEELDRLTQEESEKSLEQSGGTVKLAHKIYINQNPSPKHNVVGRILGPGGSTIKRMQNETQCKIAILGTGSMRDRQKEEECRKSGDPKYEHLTDRLHVMIEATGSYEVAKARKAAGIAEVQKMLIPPVMGEEDPMEIKYKGGGMGGRGGMGDYRDNPRHRPPPPPSRRMDDRGPKPGGYSNGAPYGGNSGYSSFSDYDDWGPGPSGGGRPGPPSRSPSRGGPRGGRGGGGGYGRGGRGRDPPQRYQPY